MAKKTSNRKGKYTPSLRTEKYKEMFDAYMEKKSVAYVSKKTGCCANTVKRYLEVGFPGYGFPPIKEQVKKTELKMREKEVDSWVNARSSSVKIVKKMKAEIIRLLSQTNWQGIEINDVRDVSTMIRAVDTLIRTEAFLFGFVPEQKISIGGKVDLQKIKTSIKAEEAASVYQNIIKGLDE